MVGAAAQMFTAPHKRRTQETSPAGRIRALFGRVIHAFPAWAASDHAQEPRMTDHIVKSYDQELKRLQRHPHGNGRAGGEPWWRSPSARGGQGCRRANRAIRPPQGDALDGGEQFVIA